MPVGYNAVLGYGVVIPITDFLIMLPNSLTMLDHAEEGMYCVSEEGFQLEEKWQISLHTDGQYPTNEVFITGNNCFVVDPRYGSNCQEISLLDLEKDQQLVQKFLDTYFPGQTLKL